MRASDEELYRRYLSERDEEAFAELFTRHREGLTLFISELMHDVSDAEDLMIEVFAIAASGTARYDGRSSLKTWLYAIGRKKAISYLRKQHFHLFTHLEATDARPDAPDDAAALAASAPSLEDEILRSEAKQLLYRALKNINEDYSQALYLTYIEDMSADETALVLNKTVKQVYNLLSRGKQSMRAELEKLGFERNDT